MKTKIGTDNTTLVFVYRDESDPRSSSDEPLVLPRLVRDRLAPELAGRFLAARHAALGPDSQSHFQKMN